MVDNSLPPDGNIPQQHTKYDSNEMVHMGFGLMESFGDKKVPMQAHADMTKVFYGDVREKRRRLSQLTTK
eukprot:CAMPEP_0172485512 /NCGR_PEP_ID=MMETSP1066-20121228/13553_1 /TAXON_ID=671091 /ORGANISM="Coscinodiscus wailesii, Strain CCMP2513" /LENGTH=69 /DNA_ID=CAMNT_0013250811 /DNA_START=114 /DNA_END=324 /DNA_ORIENTATION=-